MAGQVEDVSGLFVSVRSEGREGVWIPDVDELVAWLESPVGPTRNDDGDPFPIHCFIGEMPVLIGADWDVSAVVDEVRAGERVALLTGDAKANNVGHALAVIRVNERRMFDVGDVEGVIRPVEPSNASVSG